jgi:hypothetical protein
MSWRDPHHYYLGLDFGKESDYTAWSVIKREWVYVRQTGKWGMDFHIVDLYRFPLRTGYDTIADQVREMVTSPELTAPVRDPRTNSYAHPRRELVVDQTGVGSAVTDILKDRGLQFFGVTFRPNSEEINFHGTRRASVPTKDLVAALEVPFRRGLENVEREKEEKPPLTGVVKIAEGVEHADTLRTELLSFRRKTTKKSQDPSFEHWRQADHDDLVFACAMPMWRATHRRKGATALTVRY